MNSILLQAAAGGSGMSSLIMIVAMIAIFYFFMIRPQQKKQKEIKKAREAMKAGDRVVTAGGIHGKLKDIAETTVMIEVAPGVQMKIDKGSVFPAGVENPNAQR
ncbi:MAG: preprotein translocase subunit YajC [Muribaculaceae bacterium]|nr:preprotein translocase subunit YajC [Muribaculaceae bacterium]